MPQIDRQPVSRIDGRATFVRASSSDSLFDGWARVWANRGAAGGDGVSCETFAIETHRRLAILSRDLLSGSYRPGPLRQVDIPKSSGGLRTLSIPCVRDRVAQSSVAIILTPLLDREFEDGSYGYRPGRSVKQAVEHVRRLRLDGYHWTVDADIERYFDTIPHDRLIDRVERSITPGPLTELIRLWLETSTSTGRGVAQGSPLSPLLSNLYLDDLDEALSQKDIRIIRFADDFVLLSRSKDSAEAALSTANRLLAEQGLALHAEKTRIRGYDEGLKFLGHLFVRSWLMVDPDKSDQEETDALLKLIADRDRRAAAAEKAIDAQRKEDDATGYDRGLRVLYVREAGRTLTLRNHSFSVVEPSTDGDDRSTELAAIHPSRIDRIEIGPHVAVDDATLRHALSCDIPVAFLNGHGETLGHCTPPLAPDAARHLSQARHRLDDGLRLDLARRFVDGRLRNQRALLRRLNQRRGNDVVVSTLASLNRAIAKLRVARTVNELLGHEGEATKHYWRAWSSLLMHGFSLRTRERDSPKDPVNIVLNVTASLLGRDIGAVILRRGLHPGFGVLHAAADDHDGAVYDLMEEFRSQMVEGLSLYLINNRVVTDAMFDTIGGCRITSPGVTAIIRGYEERASGLIQSKRSGHRVTWRRLMIEQAEALVAHVEGRSSYQPFIMDY